MRDTLWHHPWAIALIVVAIGFWGELTFYTSEPGAAAMYAACAGVIAYLAAQVLRHQPGHHRHATEHDQRF